MRGKTLMKNREQTGILNKYTERKPVGFPDIGKDAFTFLYEW